MGRKKRSDRIRNPDPIIKNIRKKQAPLPQILEEDEQFEGMQHRSKNFLENLNKNKHVVQIRDEQQTTQYDQFLRQFVNENKIQVEDNTDGQMIQKCVQARTKHYEKNNNILGIKLTVKDHLNSYKEHFHKDFQIIKQKILRKSDGPEEQQKIKEKITSLFVEAEEPKNLAQANTKKLTDALNNGLKIENFVINAENKKKTLVSIEGINEEDYFIEKLIDSNIQNSIFPILNKGEREPRFKFIESAVRDYYDFQFIDPEEEFTQQFRDIYLQHIVNHIENYYQLHENESSKGFTSCKALILCPFKGDAVSIIDQIIKFQESKQCKILFQDRYTNEFADESRSMEDDFRIGISFNGKGSTKLYSNFDKADLIIASPLGLRLIVGNEADKFREFHFLSSIEILVIDRASSIAMQNWEHLETILGQINQIPEHKFVTTSLDEIRPYYWEKGAQFYRQNIINSEFNFTELNHLRLQFGQNYKGRIENRLYYMPIFTKDQCKQFQQEFINFDASNPEDSVIQRMNIFKKTWSSIEDNPYSSKTVIFVSSFFDFVKLKSYLKKINSQVKCISEYTPKPKVQSLVSKFNAGKISHILVTERAYYFDVCQIRKMKHVYFYQLPQHQSIYKSLIETIYDETTQKYIASEQNKILSLYCKYDAYQLERIVGSQQTQLMLQQINKGATFII